MTSKDVFLVVAIIETASITDRFFLNSVGERERWGVDKHRNTPGPLSNYRPWFQWWNCWGVLTGLNQKCTAKTGKIKRPLGQPGLFCALAILILAHFLKRIFIGHVRKLLSKATLLKGKSIYFITYCTINTSIPATMEILNSVHSVFACLKISIATVKTLQTPYG